MYCSICGTDVNEVQKFCTGCGARLAPCETPYVAQNMQYPNSTISTGQITKKHKKIIAGVLIGTIVLALLIVHGGNLWAGLRLQGTWEMVNARGRNIDNAATITFSGNNFTMVSRWTDRESDGFGGVRSVPLRSIAATGNLLFNAAPENASSRIRLGEGSFELTHRGTFSVSGDYIELNYFGGNLGGRPLTISFIRDGNTLYLAGMRGYRFVRRN